MRCVWCSVVCVVCVEIFKRDKRCIKYFLKLCYTRHKNDKKMFFFILGVRVCTKKFLKGFSRENSAEIPLLPYPLLPLV